MRIFLFLIFIISLTLVFYSSASAQTVDVDILWSTHTHTPLGYKGKALATPRAWIYAALFPTPSSSLNYNWYVDGRLQNNYSGVGKRVMWFAAYPTSDFVHRVEAEILNSSGSVLMRKTIFIPVIDPQVVVYEKNPLSGIFLNRSLKNLNIFKGEQKEFSAIPYFFSKDNLTSLNFTWSFNGVLLQEGSSADITFSAPDNISLVNTMKIVVKNLTNSLQKANSSFNINVQ